MPDALQQAERIVRRAGNLAPHDGGRGWEIRTDRTSLRWFSWRHGFAGRRGRRWWVHMRWTVFPTRSFLWGLYVFRDDDDERCIDLGLWPLRWEIGVADWPYPKRAEREPRHRWWHRTTRHSGRDDTVANGGQPEGVGNGS